MNILIAWIVYFGVWAMSIVKTDDIAKSKVAISILGIISIADLLYLCMYDLRGLGLVLVATGFTITGVMSQMKKFSKE